MNFPILFNVPHIFSSTSNLNHLYKQNAIASQSLCMLVLAGQILQARASSRGFFGNKNLTVDPSSNIGLCSSLITIHGYKCQEHEITTKDGYILSVQRIPEGRSEVRSNVTKKEPVIVQHGVMVDAQTWFFNSPEQNLPMILADNGFDVWIANTRGTKYSRKHTSLDASNRKYWQWSWDELVTYEMPAIFDYVSNQTGQKVNYVGHSLGTLVPLVAFSEGRLVNQLKAAALLSPIAYLSHMGTLIGDIASKSLLGESVSLVGIAEFNPTAQPTKDLMRGVCAQAGLDCNNLFTLMTGENCCLDPSAFDLFMKSQPQSSSTRNLLHLAQTVRFGALKKFDFERPSKNFLQYGQLTPPIYNLSNIPKNLPIFMSYGGKDALSDVKDVKHLLEHFKDHDADKLSVQFIKDYAHADYMFGLNAKDMVYNDVVKFFNKKF